MWYYDLSIVLCLGGCYKSPKPERSRPVTLWPSLLHLTPVQLHGAEFWLQEDNGLELEMSLLNWDFNVIKASLTVVMLRVVDVTPTKWLCNIRRRRRMTNKANWRSDRENKPCLFVYLVWIACRFMRLFSYIGCLFIMILIAVSTSGCDALFSTLFMSYDKSFSYIKNCHSRILVDHSFIGNLISPNMLNANL